MCRHRHSLIVFGLIALAGASACRGGAGSADGPGVIAGTVTFDGTPPPPARLNMDSDPKCRALIGAVSEFVVVGSGNGLRNVFVYVKDGLGDRVYTPPETPVSLDQRGCQYTPHVIGVQVGQTVKVSNSDPALHNVHSEAKVNPEFNFSQPAKVPAVDRVFAKPEIGIPIKCDVHDWMKAYANVVPHPFFAVTSIDGSYEIRGLPPGTYTVELWHETLGTQTQSVVVDGKTTARVNASFKPAA